MVKRYPHSIKIAFDGGRFVNGVWTPGTATEMITKCRIEASDAKNDLKPSQSGDVISNEWEIFCPLFEGAENVPEKGTVISNSMSNPAAFRAKDHVILRYSIYQKHISIKV